MSAVLTEAREGERRDHFRGKIAWEDEDWFLAAARQRGIAEGVLQSASKIAAADKAKNRSNHLGTTLVRLGFLSRATWMEMLAGHLGWEKVSRDEIKRADLTTARLLPLHWCRDKGVLVLEANASSIVVAFADPSDLLYEEVVARVSSSPEQKYARAKIRPKLAARPELEAHLADLESVSSPTAELSGRRFVEAVLTEAAADDASDVHFIPREQSLEIKIRVDGRLWTRHILDASRRDEIVANAKICGQLDIGKQTEPMDGSARMLLRGRAFKLRFSSMPTQYGEKVVVRLLDQEATSLPFSNLGLSTRHAADLQEAMGLPQGLVFLVGPTGCGKSTTLASLISQLDGAAYSIRTLENPIEYRLSNAIQSEISEDMTFAGGLRALLRQDPDYVLVGETRDRETAEIAIEAGLTGHMCFSTLHANDALGGITRLLDLGVSPGPLVASSKLFIAQRLVRRLCPKCSRPAETSLQSLHRFCRDLPKGVQLREPVGCSCCREGYRGRVGVYEFRWMRDFEDLVVAHGLAAAGACRERASKLGMTSLFDDGLTKVFAGLTSLDELLAQVEPPVLQPKLSFCS